MPDLFGAPPQLPAVTDGWHRPRPWLGFDTNSAAWRDYCEAWTLYHRYYDQREEEWEWKMGAYLRGVKKARGEKGVEFIKHNIVIVIQDMRGMIPDRTQLPEMLK